MLKDEIAAELQAYADFLELDGQTGRSHAYAKAADTIRAARYIPPNPARLNGIGSKTRNDVIELENYGELEALEALREKYPWYDAFRNVKHVGPSRAKKIHETFHIDSLDKLALVARNGDLTDVSGIGPKTAEKIRQSVEEKL